MSTNTPAPPALRSKAPTSDYFEANCTEPVEGISFGVGSETAQEERTTDASGIATWEQVTAGEIGILEGPAEGYQLLKVYCGVIGQNDASLPESWEEVPYSDGLTYQLPAGEYVHCVFYNVPTEDHGTIIITKYLCGALEISARDGGGPDYETFSQQCTDIGVGYVYTLQTSGGDVPGESDGSGQVIWTGLDPGEVTVTETLPTGYDSYAVYCTTDPSGPYEEFAGEQDPVVRLHGRRRRDPVLRLVQFRAVRQHACRRHQVPLSRRLRLLNRPTIRR